MIKKLYEKSEIWFAVGWIIIYVALVSVGDNLSANVGVLKIITLPILAFLSMIMYFFVSKNDLTEKYGLCKSQISSANQRQQM